MPQLEQARAEELEQVQVQVPQLGQAQVQVQVQVPQLGQALELEQARAEELEQVPQLEQGLEQVHVPQLPQLPQLEQEQVQLPQLEQVQVQVRQLEQARAEGPEQVPQQERGSGVGPLEEVDPVLARSPQDAVLQGEDQQSRGSDLQDAARPREVHP